MVNSFVSLEQAAAHMHQGAGPESLQQAAGAWSAAAHKLATAAEEILSAITRCEEQYWQSPAAQQAREALTSVTQELKHHAVVAEQTKTAATRVAAAFHKAQAATPTPHHVAENRQTRAQLVAADGLRLHQPQIAELDADYETMWLHSIVAHDTYYYDTSHALKQGEQTWWTPHQQPADTPTTARDHPPTPDTPDIPTQITQHHDTAALCRIYALDHAIGTIKHQQIYEQHSTYARTCEGLADHCNATAELCNKVTQRHREVAQLHRDLPLGQTDIPALAQKYVDIATTLKQTQQQMQKTIDALYDASETRPHLQYLGNGLLGIRNSFTTKVATSFNLQGLDLENPDLHSYTNSLQGISEQITHGASAQEYAKLHEVRFNDYVDTAKSIQNCALDRAKEAGNAWRAAHQHARSMTDNIRDFVVSLQTAARQDNQATRLAGFSA